MKKRVAVITVFCLCGFTGALPASLAADPGDAAVISAPPPAPAAVPARADALIQKGDAYYATRDKPGHADAAVRMYQAALRIDPARDEAFWKLARSYKWGGDMAVTMQARKAAYRAAEECAKQAVALNPEGVNGHLMLGVAYGMVGGTEGGLKAMQRLPLIKKEIDFVLAKDPGNEIAHLVKGVMYRVLPGFLGGSSRKSIEALKAAIRANPRRTTHYLELAKSYLKRGRREAAKRSLRGLLAITDPADPVQSKSDRKDAGDLLNRLG